MKKLKEGKLYEVHWDDAYNASGWREAADWRTFNRSSCVTVGFYLGKSKGGDLLFAATKDIGNGQYNSVSGRPPKMITKIKAL